VFLCLDNDEAGRAGTVRLKSELQGHQPPLVKAVHVIQWPEGVKDAADFFARAGQATSAAGFEALLKAANPQPDQRREAPLGAGDACEITMTPTGFVAVYAGRRYECQAIEQPNPARLKATVKAVAPGGGGGCGSHFHIDTVDFYLSRHRRVFIGEVARLLREKVEVIEADMNRLIGQLEAYAQKQAENTQTTIVLVSDEDRVEGMKLGRHPDLANEILRDVDKLGLVGEQTNKLMGYLVMTSRKLDDPLALLILSGSGAGKSLLQDTLLTLCPDEDLVKLRSLTDRALFYKGEHALQNKVLALEEVAGAQGAYYAIRNLISAKKLVIESTIKNPLTGTLTTQVNTVHGPTAVFQTTTRPDIDAETRSRFIITSVDESPEQTRAILEAQRNRHTLEGLRRKKLHEAIIKRHHAFQRLLKSLPVVNPFEPLLSYAEDRLAVRRDNPKYLNLILAMTFLHQMQRPMKHDAETAQDYLETTLTDIAIANQLATALFGQTLDELSRPSPEHSLRRFFQWLGDSGLNDVRDVTKQTVRDFREYLLGRYTTHTAHAHLIALRRFFEHLEATDALLVNPCEGVPLPKMEDRLPRNVLTPEEVRRILDAPDAKTKKGIRDKAILETFYSTGIRLEEMARLTVHDVDLSGYVRVNRGKGAKDRVVPLTRLACSFLETYLKAIRPALLQGKGGRHASASDRVFISQRAAPLSKNALGELVEKYARIAGVNKHVTCHIWRHSCATHLVKNKANLRHVQELLGHRDLSTTERYLHLTIADWKEAHRKCHPREKQADHL